MSDRDANCENERRRFAARDESIACGPWRRRVTIYAESGGVDSDLADGVRRHLSECPSCAEFLREREEMMRQLFSGVADATLREDPPLYVRLENARRASAIMEALVEEPSLDRVGSDEGSAPLSSDLWREAATALATEITGGSRVATVQKDRCVVQRSLACRWAAAAFFAVALCAWLVQSTSVDHPVQLSDSPPEHSVALTSMYPATVSVVSASNPLISPRLDRRPAATTGLWGWAGEPAQRGGRGVLFAVPSVRRHAQSDELSGAEEIDKRRTWLLEVLVADWVDSDASLVDSDGSSFFLVRARARHVESSRSRGLPRRDQLQSIYRIRPRHVTQGLLASVVAQWTDRESADRFRLYVHDCRSLVQLSVLPDAAFGSGSWLPAGWVAPTAGWPSIASTGSQEMTYPDGERQGGGRDSLWR